MAPNNNLTLFALFCTLLQQSVLFSEVLRKAGGESRVVLFEGESHAFFNKGKQMSIPCQWEFKEACQKVFGLPD